MTDMTALQYDYKGGELLIESKDDMKKRGLKSPDRADSIALTFAEPVKMIERAPPEGPGWAVLDATTGY
jgi:phage terminase large subunit